MERLTDKFKCKYNTGKIVNAHNVSKQQVIDKLSEYEDTGVTPQKVEELIKENAELKARLEKSVELPCKVGDTVYVLIQRNATTKIVKGTVRNIQHSYNAWWVEFSNLWVDKMFDDFGKTAFLTREEAEQALKGGNENA